MRSSLKLTFVSIILLLVKYITIVSMFPKGNTVTKYSSLPKAEIKNFLLRFTDA